VEQGKTAEIFSNPQHPYTLNLLNNYRLRSTSDHLSESLKLSERSFTQKMPPVLSVKNLSTWFPAKRNFFGKTTEHVKAVDEVSFEVQPGETLGVVGESGSGKTTLGRTILGLLKPTAGQVFYREKNLTQLPENEWKTLRRELQIIFQDPWNSLNPRLSVGAAIAEPMRVHGILPTQKERHEQALELLETVGLEAKHFHRFPHEFSGGQRQRLCIARALASEPKFIVCDECVSSLDVTVQTQVLDLLMKLKEEKGLTYIFISHDLSVVRLVSDRVAVMQAGKIVEMGGVGEVFFQPKMAYTRQLLSAISAGV
ncbi:MAG: ATP-binding cassette domain-containing protein, partial [Bacteroidota bacterium]